ncbi:hypothetical protein [Candidatus Xianfuyuplasma coldseepsis]|uniref:Uncharacterized protein n=1 Tax=Candidatus Xianfuyuplasma coldseepsis TaxID=2782163 RepID=A0A7L7KTM7_9MOLU|nr:hypothetical protein [Xianfuyuplasma coldseepsis]QMS85138.1 hypothetical protein G4Z02_05060 [Xianfuyuplasma coldseepsis]
MSRSTLSIVGLFLYYAVISYFTGGNVLMFAMIPILFIFILLAQLIPYSLLTQPFICQDYYDHKNVLLVVNVVHIVLTMGLFFTIALYNHVVGEISPLLGYIIVGSSLVINLIILYKDIRETWVIFALVQHIIVNALLISWDIVGFGVVYLGLLYMAIHNIVIVSYGVLRYKDIILTRFQKNKDLV